MGLAVTLQRASRNRVGEYGQVFTCLAVKGSRKNVANGETCFKKTLHRHRPTNSYRAKKVHIYAASTSLIKNKQEQKRRIHYKMGREVARQVGEGSNGHPETEREVPEPLQECGTK